ncbi:uncharacterized protein [Panulirus ornatus]|uniref:uncharacterized protein n=1 Tax=Panulirus ornatus TaxID=150431 RepID=UPI003A84C528
MNLRALVLLACAAMVLGAPQKSDSSCVLFCEDPVIGFGHYVCCDQNPGSCPPVRKECPRNKLQSESAPTICVYDPECPRTQKCCQDVCLGHKTCKDSE